MKIKKIIIFSFLALLSFSTFAQNKFGYIDSSELLSLMPEKKTAEGELQTFAKSLESQLGAMQAEYQASVQDYHANVATYTDLVKQDKIAEITNFGAVRGHKRPQTAHGAFGGVWNRFILHH